jgi:hypothetical protein
MTGPRDWDRELADIDRVRDKQGSGAPALPPRGPAAPVRTTGPAARPPVRRRSVALTWFWVALAVALGVGLAVWPYRSACGLDLAFYLGAATVTLIFALLGALASWSHRRGFAHVVSLLVIVWAGFVVLREVLPRVGYAKRSLDWTCAPAPAPAPSAAPAPAPSPTSPS